MHSSSFFKKRWGGLIFFSKPTVLYVTFVALLLFLSSIQHGYTQSNRPYLELPFPGEATYEVTCGYGCYQHQGSMSYAVDFSLAEGDPILAAAPGTVKDITWERGLPIHLDLGDALILYLDHGNGWFTRYVHLDGITVEVGQQVEMGDIIGYGGKTGASGAHLHFELKYGDSLHSASVPINELFDGEEPEAGKRYMSNNWTLANKALAKQGVEPQEIVPVEESSVFFKAVGDATDVSSADVRNEAEPPLEEQVAADVPNSPPLEEQVAADVPNSPPLEEQVAADVPNSPPLEEQIAAYVPNSPPLEEQVAPEVPNSPTLEEQVAPEVPNSPTLEEQVAPEVPNSPTLEEQVAPEVPNSPTVETEAEAALDQSSEVDIEAEQSSPTAEEEAREAQIVAIATPTLEPEVPYIETELSLSAESVRVLSPITATFTLRNGSSERLHLATLGVVARPKGDSNPINRTLFFERSIVLNPGRSYHFEQEHTFKQKGDFDLLIFAFDANDQLISMQGSEQITPLHVEALPNTLYLPLVNRQ